MTHVQELRRRVARPGAARPRMALAVRRGDRPRRASTPALLDLQRGAGGDDERDVDGHEEVARAGSYGDRLLRRAPARRSPRTARELQAAPAAQRQGPRPAVPRRRWSRRTRSRATSRRTRRSSRRSGSRSTSRPGGAILDRHRRAALGRRWPARRSAPGRSPTRCRAEHDVQLVTTSAPARSPTRASRTALGRAAATCASSSDWADVIMFQGLVMARDRWLARERRRSSSPTSTTRSTSSSSSRPRTAATRSRRDDRARLHAGAQRAARAAATSSCARREKQRDFWLGQLAGLGRINADTYDDDESLDVAASPSSRSASPTRPPTRTGTAIKGVVPGIGADDKVILWGGGIYNWFDPLTLIRAVDRLRHERDRRPAVLPRARSTRTPTCPRCAWPWRARDLADSLGLTDKHVFFNEEWVAVRRPAELPARRRPRRLAPTCSTSRRSSRFRTRILDYLWAGLPIVATRGDTFGELIPRTASACVVPAEDVDALDRGAVAAALRRRARRSAAATRSPTTPRTPPGARC